jgi:hypothetical protein
VHRSKLWQRQMPPPGPWKPACGIKESTSVPPQQLVQLQLGCATTHTDCWCFQTGECGAAHTSTRNCWQQGAAVGRPARCCLVWLVAVVC